MVWEDGEVLTLTSYPINSLSELSTSSRTAQPEELRAWTYFEGDDFFIALGNGRVGDDVPHRG